MSKRVYLAGPISGLSYQECTEWRDYARQVLGSVGIEVYSPMRFKEYLSSIDSMSPLGYSNTLLSSPRNIITRDRFDATRCDVMLVNLIGAAQVSIGTVLEMAWADLARIPVVCAIEAEGNVHEHGMLLETVGFRVDNIEDALTVVRAFLIEG